MKIKELIKKLSEFDENVEIFIENINTGMYYDIYEKEIFNEIFNKIFTV